MNAPTTLYATQELAPWFTEGGLGLTAAALPAALSAEHGLPHTIVLPYYPRLVEAAGVAVHLEQVLPTTNAGGATVTPSLHRLETAPGAPTVLLLRCDHWYDREGGIYRDPDYVEHHDAVPRAVFFGTTIARWVRESPGRFGIIHANDWQSGMLAALTATGRRHYGRPAVLFNVHNAGYRGHLPPDLVGLGLMGYELDALSTSREASLIELGIAAADAVITCSPQYASEIQDTFPGITDGWVRRAIHGIVSGVDSSVWSPALHRADCPTYDLRSVLQGKAAAKVRLRQRYELDHDEVPVVLVCGRLVPEKGVDLILDTVRPLLADRRIQLVVMGNGEIAYRRSFTTLELEYRGRVAYQPGFSQDDAHLLYAGADVTLMPSLSEPCGLNQLIAMAYGTLPVVTPVGGLLDTVVDLNAEPSRGTGFVASGVGPAFVATALTRAIDLLSEETAAIDARRRAMAKDWSWIATADRFAEEYRRLLQPRSPA